MRIHCHIGMGPIWKRFLLRFGNALSVVFGGLARGIERGITSLFGSSNARYLKKLHPTIDAITALEPKYQAMTDAELQGADRQVPQTSGGG